MAGADKTYAPNQKTHPATGAAKGIMTVLQVLAIHPFKHGSFEDYIASFARNMSERGHTSIFIFGCEPHPVVLETLEAAGCKYFVQDAPAGAGGFISFLRRLSGIIKENKVEIIQGQFLPHSHYAALAGFLTGKPSFITIHSTTNQSGQSVKPATILKNKISAALSQKFFAVSEAVKKDLVQNLHIPEKHVKVLHNGINLDRYSPREVSGSLHRELGIPVSSRIILTIAQARPEKGLEYLVRATPAIIARHPDTHFPFCGGGPLQDGLSRLAESIGVAANIHFLGVRNDVPDLLNDSYASVLPSLAEPLGNAVIEAMAMKKPVVGSDVDGIPEMIVHGSTGLLVPPGDSDALASSLIHLLEDPARTASMGVKARQRVEDEFELNSRVLAEIALYEDFLAWRS